MFLTMVPTFPCYKQRFVTDVQTLDSITQNLAFILNCRNKCLHIQDVAHPFIHTYF